MEKDHHVGKVSESQGQGYWQERYDRKEDQWEKGAAVPGLVDFLAQLTPELKRGRVIQPGCGRGHDLAQFAQEGFQGVGIDIARTAVEDAQRIYHDDVREKKLAFYCQDYFQTAKDHWHGQFDWYFEHTFFCAIEPQLRADYVRNLRAVLKPGGYFLAVFYHIQPEQGPPFGCLESELEERFFPYFELLDSCVPRSYPHRTGLELLWWMRHK